MRRTTIIILLALIALLQPFQATAQPGTDEQLAAQYFQAGDFERAILYYEKLYKKQPSPYYYEQLYKSYVGMKRYEDAEDLVKSQQRRDDDPRYFVDLGSLYRMMGEDDKAQQQFEKALKQITADQNRIRQVANAFTRNNELDLALEAYERGQKLVKDTYNFHYEIANLYAAKGDVPGMIHEYMEVLSSNEGYIQSVQNGLSRHIDFTVSDARTETLRTELLRRIQREPDKLIFHELLIWMYIQQKDLTSALVQCKALDKRFNEGGRRLLDLAGIAQSNKDYVTATKCFEYVIGLGTTGGGYLTARLGLLRTLYLQTTDQAEPTPEDLARVQQTYASVLQELGMNSATIDPMRDWAQLKAYYLGDRPGAVELLQRAIDMPSIDPKVQAQLKLDLGDVHVLNGDIWEASLLYSQVDLDFKYDVIGNEARLRNARVSFYAGDMLWALAQLDVLKASTSKLIANDAMELSLLINDNLGADSNSVPLSLYASAQLLTFQHRYDEALHVLDSLDLAFPMHSLGDDILYQRYRIAYARKRFPEAATFLEKVIELYPLDILVDNALFDLGRLYEEELNDPEKAKGYYEKLLFDQSGSIFVPEARDRFRRLRGDHADPATPEERFLNGEPQ
jgi:tetratricopeptide (TPR) repeat protein